MNVDQLQRFIGNPAAYALQLDDGSYKPVRKQVSGSLLKQHIAGEITVGTYVNIGEMARWLCFDVDTGDDAPAEAGRVKAAILEMGVPEYATGIEFSGRKGYHVWVLVENYLQASELRRLGRGVLALAEVECEVFPKQDVTRDLGNLVKLPSGKHRVSGMDSEWLTDVPFPMSTTKWETLVVPNLPPELSGRRFNVGAMERFPCMDHILSEGVQSGSRNNQLFHLATMLRRAGLTQEYVALVLNNVNEKGDPLDPFELDAILSSSQNSGPVCDQLPENRKCGDLCIRARTQGLYTRPRQLANAAEGEVVTVVVSSRAGKVIVLEHDDLDTPAKGVTR